MLKLIDTFLNTITMYRLTLYVFLILIWMAMGAAWLGLIAYSPLMILFSTAFITAVCVLTNELFSSIFKAPANVESVYITAFILVLIVSPPATFLDGSFLEIAGWSSIWAMASKYMFAIQHKHIFNPAAFGVAVTSVFLGASASWWIATLPLMPFVLVLGLLLIRKIQRFDLIVSFLLVAVASIIIPRFAIDTVTLNLWRVAVNVPLFFFAFAMLSEPLTTPPTRVRRILYGSITGILFAPWIHIGSFYGTPELALLGGNIASYLLSPKQKLMLTLQKKIKLATDTYDFLFSADMPMKFRPGQYLEWTLPHAKSDSRGNRRYFTISSSPTEDHIAVGVKFNAKGSSYKKNMLAMRRGDTMAAGQLSGDFVMPKNTKTKLAFIAGGIGITPFRSMIQSTIDSHEQRSIVLLYANRNEDDISYKDFFDAAEHSIGLRTIYTLSNLADVPKSWNGKTGYIDAAFIQKSIPDYKERLFYLSGPHSMISGTEKALRNLGVPGRNIKTDFFPGFA